MKKNLDIISKCDNCENDRVCILYEIPSYWGVLWCNECFTTIPHETLVSNYFIKNGKNYEEYKKKKEEEERAKTLFRFINPKKMVIQK